jgi:hypothetical protein
MAELGEIMRFQTLEDANRAARIINAAFAKRGHLNEVFIVKPWAYGYEVVEKKVTMPK